MVKAVISAALHARSKLRARRNAIEYARSLGVTIGERCRLLGVGSETFGSEPYLIKVGDHVTVTSGVKFVTHDGGVWVFRDEHPEIDVFGRIKIGNNVFIGVNTTILPGVTIGDNVVIGAGAVVNRSIPKNSVAAGVPAKVVSSLDRYHTRSVERMSPTKGLSPEDKHAYLSANLP